MNSSFRDVARRLQIGVGSAYRLHKRFLVTGELSPSKRAGCRQDKRKLDEYHELYIMSLLIDNPGLYLNEMCSKIKDATGVSVSGSTVCRVLRRNGFTRKKIRQIAKQRSVKLRGAYMAEIIYYPGDFLVWLDETGSDKRDHIRKFGYQIRSLPPICHRFLARGTRVSAISAICSEGLLAHDILSGTTNGEKFCDFLRGCLIPCMQPFPAPRSILVMDNCSIHHVQPVKDLLQACGILLIFLPPYSPDYNPCEEMFSYIKYYLKDHDELLNHSTSIQIFRQILNSGFLSVTESQCKQWIAHAGYCT